jgi:hypothetical protein
MFYVRKSYRDIEEWLLASDQVCQALGLSCVPDHTTLYRMYRRLGVAHIRRLQQALLANIDLQEDEIAVDTTGFSPTQASEHYLSRRGVRYRHFTKGGYAVGTRSQLILGSKYGQGPGADQPFLEPLRRQAACYGKHNNGQPVWVLLGDMGFDAQSTREDDLIPPIRRGGSIRSPERQARQDLVSQARLDGLFGQRWKAETVNSVIKRKFGDEIRSKKTRHRNREPIVKGLVYNVHRCITAGL